MHVPSTPTQFLSLMLIALRWETEMSGQAKRPDLQREGGFLSE